MVGGAFGLHRFYTGRPQSAVCMCLTLGGFGLWWLYDVVVLAAGDFRDGDGRRVVRWEVGEGGTPRSPRSVEDLEERLQGLETQVSELAERLDFTERLLAQVRERGSLPEPRSKRQGSSLRTIGRAMRWRFGGSTSRARAIGGAADRAAPATTAGAPRAASLSRSPTTTAW